MPQSRSLRAGSMEERSTTERTRSVSIRLRASKSTSGLLFRYASEALWVRLGPLMRDEPEMLMLGSGGSPLCAQLWPPNYGRVRSHRSLSLAPGGESLQRCVALNTMMCGPHHATTLVVGVQGTSAMPAEVSARCTAT